MNPVLQIDTTKAVEQVDNLQFAIGKYQEYSRKSTAQVAAHVSDKMAFFLNKQAKAMKPDGAKIFDDVGPDLWKVKTAIWSNVKEKAEEMLSNHNKDGKSLIRVEYRRRGRPIKMIYMDKSGQERAWQKKGRKKKGGGYKKVSNRKAKQRSANKYYLMKAITLRRRVSARGFTARQTISYDLIRQLRALKNDKTFNFTTSPLIFPIRNRQGDTIAEHVWTPIMEGQQVRITYELRMHPSWQQPKMQQAIKWAENESAKDLMTYVEKKADETLNKALK